MRKVLFLTISLCILSSCLQNELDLSYSETKDTPPMETFDIEGVWTGILNCPACCDDIYDFDLEITNYNPTNGQLNAELVVTRPDQEWLAEAYAKYHCEGSFMDNMLHISTIEMYEEESSSCFFCEQNIYQFNLLEDNSLSGVWNSSSNCDPTVISSATISITKQ